MPSITRADSRADQKFARVLRTVCCLVAMFFASGASATVKAWAWDRIDPSCTRNMSAMVDAFPEYRVEDVVRRLNALPDGNRVLLLMRYTDDLATNPADFCRRTVNGRTVMTSFPGPWCAAGQAAVKARVERFFNDLVKAGVKKIDALIVDNETTFWAGRFVSATGENVAAIEADPRYSVIAKRMGATSLRKLAWGSAEYFRWNEIIAPDFDAALNAAVFQPFRQRWPAGIACNYGSTPIASRFMTPDMGGLGIVAGPVAFGSHNSLSFYGNSLHWIRGAAFAGTTLNDTPFDMFRLNVHRIRAAGASSSRAMLPWIANYSLGCNGEGKEPGGYLSSYMSPIAMTAYWDENVIQLAMHGCDTMLLFNPAAWRKDQNPAIWNKLEDQVRLARLLEDINTRLGSTPGSTRWFSLPGLQDRVMATGRTVTGGTLWRFSFAPDVSSVVVTLKNGEVREVLREEGTAGAWYFEATNEPLAIKKDGADVAWTEAPKGSAFPDLDDDGALTEGDLSLLMLEMGERGSSLDLDGDGVVTKRDTEFFRGVQRSWREQSTAAAGVRPGASVVAMAR